MLRWVALQLRLGSLTSSHTMGAEDLHSSFSGRRGRARRLPLTAELWALAWPAILRNVLNCACDRLTLALVGHYDPSTVHYDGAGLGKMYSNITGLSVGLGLNLGLATLCSQAYGAGRAAEENALHLRRCAVWLVAAFAYSAVAVLFAERLLRLAAQPAVCHSGLEPQARRRHTSQRPHTLEPRLAQDVAAASAAYARVQLPGVPLYWGANALQTVCDGLQDTRPGLWSNLVSAAAQVALSVLLVHPKLGGMGYLGVAAARSWYATRGCNTGLEPSARPAEPLDQQTPRPAGP